MGHPASPGNSRTIHGRRSDIGRRPPTGAEFTRRVADRGKPGYSYAMTARPHLDAKTPRAGLGLSAFLAMVVFLATSAEARIALTSGTQCRPAERALVRQITAAIARVACDGTSLNKVCPSGRGPAMCTRVFETPDRVVPPGRERAPGGLIPSLESLLDLPPPTI